MPRAEAVFTGPAEIAFTRMFAGPDRSLNSERRLPAPPSPRPSRCSCDHAGGAQIGERHHRPAVAHQRGSRASDRDQRIGADILSQQKTLAEFRRKAALKSAVGESDAVNHRVERLSAASVSVSLTRSSSRVTSHSNTPVAPRAAPSSSTVFLRARPDRSAAAAALALERLRDGVGKAPAIGNAQNQR